MPGTLALSVITAGAAALVAAGSALGFRAWKLSRITPEERERHRRSSLVARGKINDAMLVEIRENLLFFSYGVRGVEYTASQDVSSLKPYLPPDFSAVGPVSVKYDPRNPANSIVVAEQWSGLRGKAG